MLPTFSRKPKIMPFWTSDNSLHVCITPTIVVFSEAVTHSLYTLNSTAMPASFCDWLFNPLSGYLPPEKLSRKRFTLILLFPSKMQQTSILPPFKTWEVERRQLYDFSSSSLISENQDSNRLQLAVKLPWAILYENRSSTLSFSL
ncbi:hypothetical protein TNCV_432001 [Trichonephila clavipes]|nr:hypothetical protein TNCV_432001 [Trichonephila clavipes]